MEQAEVSQLWEEGGKEGSSQPVSLTASNPVPRAQQE